MHSFYLESFGEVFLLPEIQVFTPGLFTFAFAFAFAQRKSYASLNENCVLRSTEIMCFSQRASLKGNCVLLPAEIVCFSQRSSLNRNCVLRPTLFAQRKLYGGREGLFAFAFAQRKSCASLNENCVLRSTRFAQRKLRASPYGNCVLRSTTVAEKGHPILPFYARFHPSLLPFYARFHPSRPPYLVATQALSFFKSLSNDYAA